MEQIILLIGFMGSGKTSVGKELAQRLDVPFSDSDEWIEDLSGRPVTAIFAEDGEETFREWEQLFMTAMTMEPQIVACGGGLPCFNGLIHELKARGTVIYLKATPETLVSNLKNEDLQLRPLLKDILNEELQETITAQLENRREIYEQAHYTVTIDGKPVTTIVDEIQWLLKATA